MREYSKVSPLFWTGTTGRKFRGQADAQRVAFYLMTCPSANMIGLYYLPLPTLMHELGITLQGASKALARVSEVDFAHYDAPSEYVWVPKMAVFQIGETLEAKDKRHLGLLRELETHRKSPFFNDFVILYRERYLLQDVALAPSPLQAPCKPLRSQEQEQEQDLTQTGACAGPTVTDSTIPKPPSDEQQDHAAGAYTADFEKFWQAYPKKTGKGDAFKVWTKAKHPHVDTLLEILERARRAIQWQKDNGRFIPNPSTWLNQKRWDDDYGPVIPNTREAVY